MPEQQYPIRKVGLGANALLLAPDLLARDNLNTHKPASLYEAFPAAEARPLVERFGRVSRRDCTSGFSQNSA